MKKEILDYVGPSEQLSKTQEECAELIKACAKYRDVIYPRKSEYPPAPKYTRQLVEMNLKEEIAHVLNCIESLLYLLKIDKNEIKLIQDNSDQVIMSRFQQTKQSNFEDGLISLARKFVKDSEKASEELDEDIPRKAAEVHDLLMKLDDCLLTIVDNNTPKKSNTKSDKQ